MRPHDPPRGEDGPATSESTGPSREFDVRELGAVGDGAADDTSAINFAIRAANDALGGVVHLPAGVYRVTKGLLPLGARVVLRGDPKCPRAGAGGTSIRLDGHTGSLIQLGHPSDPVRRSKNGVEHLTLECLVDDAATFRQGITGADHGSNVVITTSSEHGYFTGDEVVLVGVSGLTGIDGEWTITRLTSTTFSLDGSARADQGRYAGGGAALGRARFDRGAAAGIEVFGSRLSFVRRCNIIGFPIGICLDGASECTVSDSSVRSSETGYSDAARLGKGVWFADSGVRRFTGMPCSATHHIERLQASGNARDVDFGAAHRASLVSRLLAERVAFDGTTSAFVEAGHVTLEHHEDQD